jgi:hypothetical protein
MSIVPYQMAEQGDSQVTDYSEQGVATPCSPAGRAFPCCVKYILLYDATVHLTAQAIC